MPQMQRNWTQFKVMRAIMFFCEKMIQIAVVNMQRLLDSIRNNDMENTRAMLRKDRDLELRVLDPLPSVDNETHEHRPCCYAAIESGSPEMAKFIISKSGIFGPEDDILHQFAFESGDVEIAKLFVEALPSANKQNTMALANKPRNAKMIQIAKMCHN
jgi:hypothetical protein